MNPSQDALTRSVAARRASMIRRLATRRCLAALGASLVIAAMAGTIRLEPARSAELASLGDTSREQECLAVTIYHEAKGEPREGQIAVAHVILNRRGKGEFPATICEVVKQGSEKSSSTCQFSIWCDGRAEQKNPGELAESMEIARGVLTGDLDDPTHGAQWFHATDIVPAWAKQLIPTVRIGKHQFLRAGQRN